MEKSETEFKTSNSPTSSTAAAVQLAGEHKLAQSGLARRGFGTMESPASTATNRSFLAAPIATDKEPESTGTLKFEGRAVYISPKLAVASADFDIISVETFREFVDILHTDEVMDGQRVVAVDNVRACQLISEIKNDLEIDVIVLTDLDTADYSPKWMSTFALCPKVSAKRLLADRVDDPAALAGTLVDVSSQTGKRKPGTAEPESSRKHRSHQQSQRHAARSGRIKDEDTLVNDIPETEDHHGISD